MIEATDGVELRSRSVGEPLHDSITLNIKDLAEHGRKMKPFV
jgi:hypothetical protein